MVAPGGAERFDMSKRKLTNEQRNGGVGSPATATTSAPAGAQGAGWPDGGEGGGDGARKRQRAGAHRAPGGRGAGPHGAGEDVDMARTGEHRGRADAGLAPVAGTTGRGGAHWAPPQGGPAAPGAALREPCPKASSFGLVSDALAGFRISEGGASGRGIASQYSEMNKVLREAHFELRRKWEREEMEMGRHFAGGLGGPGAFHPAAP